MSEYETDPQRPSANADAAPSHPTAELPPVDRGQSDSTSLSTGPVADDRADDTGSTAPGSPYPAPSGPGSAYAPPAGGYAGGYAAPGPVSAPAAPTSPYAAPDSPYARPVPAAAPQSAPAAPGGHTYPPSPWHPAHPQTVPLGQSGQPGQPGWSANPGYPGSHIPGAHLPPPAPGAGGVVPPWAQGPGAAGPAPRPGRLARIVAIGAAALVLMAGSGLAGGAIALALDGGGGVTKTYTAAPILNSADLPKIAAAVANSVVSISTGTGEGSGVVLSADGFILTNNHVVAGASGNTVRVVFANGKSAQARVVGTDPKTDLAVIQAQGVSDLVPAKLGDSDAMQVGDTVLALGSPLGLQGSVTAGILSAKDRTIRAGGNEEPQNPFAPQQQQQQGGASSISGLLQTDAPINPGNSGGALVNTKGEVIGINTAIATAGQGSTGNIGVGFAIPSNKAGMVADQLRKGQKVSHPYLGVSVTESEQGGAVVGSITPNSPADQAGLQQGDVITRFDDKVINDSSDLVGAVQAGKVGDKVQLTFTRNGVEKTATVTLAETS